MCMKIDEITIHTFELMKMISCSFHGQRFWIDMLWNLHGKMNSVRNFNVSYTSIPEFSMNL